MRTIYLQFGAEAELRVPPGYVVDRTDDFVTLYLQFGAESELRVPPGYVVDQVADFVTELQLPVG